jgi:hypothetical protein
MIYVARNDCTGKIKSITSVNFPLVEGLLAYIKKYNVKDYYYIPNSCVRKLTGNDGWAGNVWARDFLTNK